MPNVTLFRADVPIDSAGNVASRDLYRLLSDIVARVGGANGTNPEADTLQQALAVSALRRNIPDQPTPSINLQRQIQVTPRSIDDSELRISLTRRFESQKPIDESGSLIASRVFARR